MLWDIIDRSMALDRVGQGRSRPAPKGIVQEELAGLAEDGGLLHSADEGIVLVGDFKLITFVDEVCGPDAVVFGAAELVCLDTPGIGATSVTVAARKDL